MAITNTDAQIRMLEGAVGRDYTAGGSFSIGDPVYVNSSGNVLAARANAAATSYAIGIAVASTDGDTSIVSGERVTVCVFGPVGGFAGLVEGGLTYLDSAAVGLVDAALTGTGKWSHVVGYGERDSVLFVMPAAAAPTSLS